MPLKAKTPKATPLISIFQKFFITDAAKTKSAQSYAPHIYLSKIFITDAAKTKSAQSHAPHIYLSKTFHH